MQQYSFSFSRKVFENFINAKPRGWYVLRKLTRIPEGLIIKKFTRKDMEFWECFKAVVSLMDWVHKDKVPTVPWNVWVLGWDGRPRIKRFNELLNKCLVLTPSIDMLQWEGTVLSKATEGSEILGP